jgi:hypothetical protein
MRESAKVEALALAASFPNSRASMNVTNAPAFTLAWRPVGNTLQRSMGGKDQSLIPGSNSEANIQSDETVRLKSAHTASRTPSAAMTRTRPLRVTEGSADSCLKVHLAPYDPDSFYGADHRGYTDYDFHFEKTEAIYGH